MGNLYRVLLSLRTVFWLFAAALGCFVFGSLMIPEHLAFYSGIDDTPLFFWLRENRDPLLTSWIYGIVGILGLIAASTIACTVEYLRRGIGGRNFLLRLSPQVMHVGVLFIMLGHLLSAAGGFRQDQAVGEGSVFPVDPPISLELTKVRLVNDADGFPADWFGTLWWRNGEIRVRKVEISPSHPSFFRGYGVWFSSVSVEDDGTLAGVFRTARDPGVVWALMGAVILCCGGFLFLAVRSRTLTRLLYGPDA